MNELNSTTDFQSGLQVNDGLDFDNTIGDGELVAGMKARDHLKGKDRIERIEGMVGSKSETVMGIGMGTTKMGRGLGEELERETMGPRSDEVPQWSHHDALSSSLPIEDVIPRARLSTQRIKMDAGSTEADAADCAALTAGSPSEDERTGTDNLAGGLRMDNSISRECSPSASSVSRAVTHPNEEDEKDSGRMRVKRKAEEVEDDHESEVDEVEQDEFSDDRYKSGSTSSPGPLEQGYTTQQDGN